MLLIGLVVGCLLHLFLIGYIRVNLAGSVQSVALAGSALCARFSLRFHSLFMLLCTSLWLCVRNIYSGELATSRLDPELVYFVKVKAASLSLERSAARLSLRVTKALLQGKIHFRKCDYSLDYRPLRCLEFAHNCVVVIYYVIVRVAQSDCQGPGLLGC
jgi:hypothetical protein